LEEYRAVNPDFEVAILKAMDEAIAWKSRAGRLGKRERES
jgi:hypothetical protein